MMKYFPVIILLLAGCASSPGPQLDGSSEAAFVESLDAMNRALSPAKRRQLTEALVLIHFKDVESAFEVLAKPELQRFKPSDLRDELDGMTFDDIIDYSKESKVTIVEDYE